MTPAAPAPSVLVIDDESQIRRLMRITLEANGYRFREAESGRLGLVEIAAHPPDVVLLDLGLPDLTGVEVVRQLREWSHVPVIVVTVLSAEADQVAALDAGADYYLTKPFSAGELLARLRAVLRRVRTVEEPATVKIGDLEVDLSARIVRRGGAEVRLTPTEYAIFRLLVVHRGKVVTHREIHRDLLGPHAEGRTDHLRVHMTHLRQKLETEPHRPRYLKTESGIGFRLQDGD